MAQHDLAPMPTEWTTALAVVAHPDDLEYGASGAVANWTDSGRHVTYLLLTAGEAGIDTLDPDEARRLRADEQVAACEAVGVVDLEILDHPDGMLTYGLEIRRDIARAIRRVRPEMVITLNHRETFGPGRLNMADHIVVGQATIDAVRDAANRWVFRELAESEGLEPWGGVRWVAVANSPLATHRQDLGSRDVERAVASLAAHRAYLEALGPGPMSDPDTFLRDRFARSGGEGPAITFEVMEV